MTAFAACWREPLTGAFGARNLAPAVWREADAGIDLIRPGLLFAPMVLTRAQASGAMATTLAADGATWQEVGADVPRFYAAPRRLMIGGQRTNLVRNARAEGAVAGAPGMLPTNWSSSTTTNGLTRSVVGYETINGVSCVLVRFAGTATATGAFVVLFEPAAQIAATVGQVFSVSAVMRATNEADVPQAYRLTVRGVGGTALDESFIFAINSTSLTRCVGIHTVTDAASTSIRPGFSITYTLNQVIDTTIAIGFVQTELAPFASSPILPAIGTPAASTRGADLVSASLSSLGIGANGACTVLVSGVMAGIGGANQRLCTLHDNNGSFTNAVSVLVTASGNVLPARTTATAFASGAAADTVTAGVPARFGIAINGAGGAAVSVNGATATTVAGAPTGGLTTFELGGWLSAERAFLEVSALRVLPFAVSDTDLQRLVAGMPT